MGMGVAGVDMVLVSIGDSALLMITPDWVFFSDRARSKYHRQTVQVQSVLGNVRSVRCAMQ